MIPRCFCGQENFADSVVLSSAETHHLLRVRRAARNSEVEVFNGAGLSVRARLVAAESRQARLVTIPGSLRLQPPLPVRLTLIQAVPARAAMETIVRQAVELGIHTLQPLRTERAAVQIRESRWGLITVEAAKQCGQNRVPALAPVRSLAEVCRDILPDQTAAFVGSLASDAPCFKEALATFADLADSPPAAFALAIGPEGDWTANELQLLADAGVQPVSFGRLTLRVDTAALYGLSVLIHEFSRAATA